MIHNIIAPYRRPLFRALASLDGIDLRVYFCAETHKERNWRVVQNSDFHNEVLNGIAVDLGGAFTYHINPSIAGKLLRCKFDAVIIGGYSDFTTQLTFALSKVINLPIVLWTEAIGDVRTKLDCLTRPVLSKISKNVNSIVVPGTRAMEYQIKTGAPPEKVFIAPNIVDNDLFYSTSMSCTSRKTRLKSELGWGASRRVVLYVGQLIPRKGVDVLVDAYELLHRDLRDVTLVIVGDGPERRSLEDACSLKGLRNVRFTGWVDERTKALYYALADVFVIPSYGDVWGLVVNEAMASGLPVVSTSAVGAAHDMIRDGWNGFITEPGNPEQIRQALKSVLSNEEDTKMMGERSREVIRRQFEVTNMVNGFAKALSYALGG